MKQIKDQSERFENYVRKKHPSRALAADYGGSRKDAIYLMCLSCAGDSISTVSECTSTSCPLWRYRPGTSGKETSDSIPTREELMKLQ